MEIKLLLSTDGVDRLKLDLLNAKVNYNDSLSSRDFEERSKEDLEKVIRVTNEILKEIELGTVKLDQGFLVDLEANKQISKNLIQLILAYAGGLP